MPGQQSEHNHVRGGNRMTTTGIAIGQLSEAEHSRQLRRAVVASTVGTIIEAYDFLLYVLVAPLVFAKLYFPESDPLVGILQAFGIYAVGFISALGWDFLKPLAFTPSALPPARSVPPCSAITGTASGARRR